MATHALFKSSSGYAIFEVKLHEDIGLRTKAVQDSINDLAKFGKMVSLISFSPFKNAADALENINDISEEGLVSDLRSLDMNLSKPVKGSKLVLAVSDVTLGMDVKELLGISFDLGDTSQEIIRGIRMHAAKLLKADDIAKAQLGLGHSYSSENMATHALFESSSGYAIFEVKLHEDIGLRTKAVQDSINDLAKFGKMVSLISFSPFKNAADALENINDISEGLVSDHLRSSLELNLSKPAKGSKLVLAVSDATLGMNVKELLGISFDLGDTSQEIIRGIRMHAAKLLKGLESDDIAKAQLGLGHSYSRAKLKFNVNRIDNMIIQAIALLDQLDKDVNLFAMRIREWYGYHFPELVKLVPDNYQYACVARFIGDKDTLNEEKLADLAVLVDDNSTVAQNILDAARGSMGSSLSEIDMLNISAFATRVVSIADYRKSLVSYLSEKMNLVAPSLTALLGERIGARLISHAGSLTNLSKYPASTVQILGAEKALFRALKTKGNTPKYGLLYHSSFISRAGPKHKGRISRFLANKCSIASRIDCYTDNPTPKFGEALRAQVEERLNFFETGAPPSKNADVIRKVLDSLPIEVDDEDEDMSDAEPVLPLIEPEPVPKKEKKKKRKSDDMDVDGEEEGEPVKKVKLSKEEKKALKKAAKKEAKKAAKEAESTKGGKGDKGEDVEMRDAGDDTIKKKKEKKHKDKEKRKSTS